MIGKVILGVLAVVVLLLAAALMLPVRLRFSCEDGELRLSVRCGPVRVQLFPPKKKETPAPETAEPVGEADEKPENPAAPPAERRNSRSTWIRYSTAWMCCHRFWGEPCAGRAEACE